MQNFHRNTPLNLHHLWLQQYRRTYTDADKLCSNFITDVKLFPQENKGHNNINNNYYYFL